MKRVARAFTLVELLVVVSIIGLLVAILVPSLKKARDQTKQVTCATNVRSITQATLTYAHENNDFVPKHQGAEPNYIYVKNSTTVEAPDHEWHLGELLMPQMKITPPQRGTDDAAGTRKFAEAELRRTRSAAQVFYCPATNNSQNVDPRFPTWGFPSTFGSFMDYAQFWHYVSAGTRELRGDLIALDYGYVVLDDEQDRIVDPGSTTGMGLYRLPKNVSRRDYVKLPGCGPASQVPVCADYITSFNRTQPQYKTDFATGKLKPDGGNHRWTGHSSGSNVPVMGGNFAYIDAHVEWRPPSQLKPRLIIDKEFTGGTKRPTYWW